MDLFKTTGICGVYSFGFVDFGKYYFRFIFLTKKEILKVYYDLLESFFN